MITITKEKMLIPKGEEFLGYAGDNLHKRRTFLLKDEPAENLTFRIYLRFDDLSHNFFTVEGENTDDGIEINWDISDLHITKSGYVLLQIKAFAENGNEIFHTPTGCFYVGRSLEFEGEFNDIKANSEFLSLEKKLNEINSAALKAPIIGKNGNWWCYDSTLGEYTDTKFSAKGAKGDKGDKGEKGDTGDIDKFLTVETNLINLMKFTDVGGSSTMMHGGYLELKTREGLSYPDYDFSCTYIKQINFQDIKNGTSDSFQIIHPDYPLGSFAVPPTWQTMRPALSYKYIEVYVEKEDYEAGRCQLCVPEEYGFLSCDEYFEMFVKNDITKNTGIDKAVYLSDLEWESAVSGWSTVKKDTNVNGVRLAFCDSNGKIFYCDKGLGTHSRTAAGGVDSVIKYRFKQGEYDAFEVLMGVDANTASSATEVSFAIGYIDANGNEVSEYLFNKGNDNGEFMNKYSTARLVHVDIPPAATGITLKCWSNSATIEYGGHWANWGNAQLIKYAEATNPTIQEQIKNLEHSKADAAHLAVQIWDNTIKGAKLMDGAVTASKIADGAITAEKLNTELYNQLAEKAIDSIVTEASIESPLDLNAEAAENHSIVNGELVSDNYVDSSAEVHIPYDCTVLPQEGAFPTVFTLYKFKNGVFEEMIAAGGLSGIELKGGFTYRFVAYHNSLPVVIFNPTRNVVIRSEKLKNAIKNLIREVIAES